MKSDQVETIERYTPNERSHHWITAIAFVLLALSGLALFHPAMFWLTVLFGGGQWTRILHPFIGLVFFVSFVLLAGRFWAHNMIDADDRKWLRQFNDVIAKRENLLPEVGRYNAGQKVLFFLMVICVVVLLMSGLVMWQRYFGDAFSPGVVRAVAVVHAFFAFVFIVGMIVHVYAAIWVKGSVGAMTRGTVTLGWARKHHAKWYRQRVK